MTLVTLGNRDLPTHGPQRIVVRMTAAGRMLFPFVGAGLVGGWLIGGTTGLFAAASLGLLGFSPLFGWLAIRRLELALVGLAIDDLADVELLYEIYNLVQHRLYVRRAVANNRDPNNCALPGILCGNLGHGGVELIPKSIDKSAQLLTFRLE